MPDGATPFGRCGCARGPGGGIEGLLHGLVGAMEHAGAAESTAARRGLLQALDPRAKLIGLGALILSVTLTHRLAVLAALFALAVGLALASRLGPGRMARQVWLGVALFSGALALPALVLVPGPAILHLPGLGWPVTAPGLTSAAFLLGRAETAASFAALLILTTPWSHVLKAMRAVGVPVGLVGLLGMTHRYIFLLLQTALQMFEARRARMLAPPGVAARRRVLVAGVGVLLTRSLALAGEVHLAMVARGYRGDVRLIEDFRLRPRDGLAVGVALLVPVAILLGGR
jgi:cobalt ECF transporter T component CbiQ